MNSQAERLAGRYGSQLPRARFLPVPLFLCADHAFGVRSGSLRISFLLALPDTRVIFGINSVDFCNIGQLRVML